MGTIDMQTPKQGLLLTFYDFGMAQPWPTAPKVD